MSIHWIQTNWSWHVLSQRKEFLRLLFSMLPICLLWLILMVSQSEILETERNSRWFTYSFNRWGDWWKNIVTDNDLPFLFYCSKYWKRKQCKADRPLERISWYTYFEHFICSLAAVKKRLLNELYKRSLSDAIQSRRNMNEIDDFDLLLKHLWSKFNQNRHQ